MFNSNVLFSVKAAMLVGWLDHQSHALMITQDKITL